MSEDLFKEIDADLRVEKLQNLTRRYAKIVGGVLVVILLGIGGWQVQKWQSYKKLEQASASYLRVVQQIDPVFGKTIDQKTTDTAISQLDQLSKQAPQSIRILTQLQEAALLAKEGKVKEASQIWEAIRVDEKATLDFRSLASLLWIQHHLDEGDPAKLYERIKEFSGQQTPWTALLRECEALLDLRTGKLVEARQIFGQLSIDMNASPNMRKRAGMILQVIANADINGTDMNDVQGANHSQNANHS